MSRRTPPRKLNIGDIASSPVGHQYHHGQGIAALFAITFDLRVRLSPTKLTGRPVTLFHGNSPRVRRVILMSLYVEQNISGVEFKSMPSGLHNVTEDLVYFSGLSALISGTL